MQIDSISDLKGKRLCLKCWIPLKLKENMINHLNNSIQPPMIEWSMKECYLCRIMNKLIKHIGKNVCLSCRIKLRIIRQHIIEYLYHPKSNYVNQIKNHFNQYREINCP